MSRISPFLKNLRGKKLEIKHAQLYCGLGGLGKGCNEAEASFGDLTAGFRCLGGIDVDPAGIRDFEKLARVKGTVLDLFSLEQYIAFHGKKPPAGWHEATPDDIRRAYGYEDPDVIALSAPCKGFSGLLAEKLSKTDKYGALNQLAMRGVWLTLEAYKDNLPAIWIFENVPRIQSRGRHLLDQIIELLRHYGYVVAETTHDCGELGNLGQSRKRFLMVARLVEKVPNYLYEPVKHPLRSVGDVIGRFPLPGDTVLGGPMHRIPSLQWKTWVRLAFVPPGKDWRALNDLAVENGVLRDFGLVPEYHHGYLGVQSWKRHSGTVTSRSGPSNGAFAVDDPNPGYDERYPAYGVVPMNKPVGTITSARSPGQGPYSVAEDRPQDGRFNNIFRVVRFDQHSPAVTSGSGPSGGAICVADPSPGKHPTYKQIKYRLCRYEEPSGSVVGASTSGYSAFAVADPSRKGEQHGKYAVASMDGPSRTVIGGSTTGQGAFAVASPAPNIKREKGDAYLHSRLFGMVPWTSPSFVVSGNARHDNGPNNVCDPRPPLPAAAEKLVCYIRSMDGTWHRPFTTLELAALQGLVEPEEYLELDGLSDSAWRERIGNAVPPPTAKAIAEEIGRTLLMAHAGETFTLGSTPIWVRNVAPAPSVAMPEGLA